MKYIISITLIICLFSNHFFSQNIKNIDSLLLVSKTSRDTSLINVLNLIGSYYTNSDLDTSNYYLNLSVKNVEKLMKNGNGDDYYIAIVEIKKVNAIKFIGYNSYQKGNYKEATSIYNNALVDLSNILDNKKKLTTKQEIDIQTQILKLKSVIIGNIGLVFHKQGDYSNAIENYLSAIKIADNLNDKKLLSIHFSNIGGVYMIQKNYEKALDYAYKSLKIKEELGNKNGIAITLNNIGIIYKNLGRYKEALDMYDKAFALNKDLKSKVGIGFNMANMAIVYALQKDYAKALDLNVKVLSIKEEIGDLNGTGLAMYNIGQIKFVLGKYNEAEKYLLSANDIAKKFNL
jgi:tetratricopeptide (TPR) repeat protein